jgi:hypothetical protein
MPSAERMCSFLRSLPTSSMSLYMQLRLRVPKGAAWYARSAPLLMEARLTPAAIEAAAARMNLYMLACILEAVTRVGSPVDAVDNHGNTPLHCAVWGQMTQRSSSLAKAQCLLAAGCSPYAENAHGSTPLSSTLLVKRLMLLWYENSSVQALM